MSSQESKTVSPSSSSGSEASAVKRGRGRPRQQLTDAELSEKAEKIRQYRREWYMKNRSKTMSKTEMIEMLEKENHALREEVKQVKAQLEKLRSVISELSI